MLVAQKSCKLLVIKADDCLVAIPACVPQQRLNVFVLFNDQDAQLHVQPTTEPHMRTLMYTYA